MTQAARRLPDPEQCSKCSGHGTVYYSVKKPGYRYQRRKCLTCGWRWTTFISIINPAKIRFVPTKRRRKSNSLGIAGAKAD